MLGAVCGPTTDGRIATLHVTPKPDLVKRLTPGNNNGVIRTLLDEGCELADTFGHPLSLGSTARAQAPATTCGSAKCRCRAFLPGGSGHRLLATRVITVRILEGDVNTDCMVDVTDQQMNCPATARSSGRCFTTRGSTSSRRSRTSTSTSRTCRRYSAETERLWNPFRRSRRCRRRATRKSVAAAGRRRTLVRLCEFAGDTSPAG